MARTEITIRAPSLHGYVVHAHSGAVIGLLRHWVPPSSYGKSLRDINVSAVPLNIRHKWADQVRQTVANLHSIGIIGGDAKPSNIIVNKSDNIELIDFAGGWSQGWVDEPLAETMEGDDQAVGRIVQFLGI
ncbi:Protein kinase-like domain protein [Metarhizium rileyi]|uniref:Protein kinase-like domain protein n=1 Tax=Metarhizium rileyi (strain RCEF 4871) TaxID=1649241 RepID=A0A166RUV1_METRR|nr:Protein kinase-like domain protein [Metarhizium rileyi RCEF 4871]